MSFSFIHAADLHLDTPFIGLEYTNPALASRLRDASLLAFDGLIDSALERRVDLVVFAGDLYDGAERGLRAQLRLRHGLQRLSDAGIHSFLAHGNHDPVEEGWSAIRDWPKRTHVFPADRATTVSLEIRDRRVHVHGTSYPRRKQAESLLPRFTTPTTPGFHLAVLHAHVGASTEHASYSPCTIEQLASVGMDYWALGHIHQAATLRERSPKVVYPGNLQGRSFKASEQGPKGASHVLVDGERIVNTPLDLAPVRFEEASVAINGLEDLSALVVALVREVDALRSDGRLLLVRARLQGRGRLSDELRRDGAIAGLLDGLRDRAPYDVTWMGVLDQTRPPLDLEALSNRDDLQSAVLAAARVLERPSLLALLRQSDALSGLAGLLTAAGDLEVIRERALLDVLHLLSDSEST